MFPRLPIHLIHTILLISANVIAEHDGSSSSTALASPTSTPLTLWDVGFSLKRDWANLQAEEECPVPPDLIGVDDKSQTGDSDVLEDVVSTSQQSETSSVPVPSAKPVDVEPPNTDTFVGFEEWKKMKAAEEELDTATMVSDYTSTSVKEKWTDSAQRTEDTKNSSVDRGDRENKTVSSDQQTEASVSSTKLPTASPPPAHNRYNYASPDCSARIHSSSPQTQHASGLLHKSRDRYMLTPCKADQHWVVVELCDEIRIDAIEVASWEFFSGVVREVQVSVGGEEDDEGDWQEVETFIGKNVRGAQVFTLSNPTSFHRFIRLDFPSYYGTEYYCPVSHLKVFGMNQMEAFKWEQKRQATVVKEKESINRDREQEEREAREKLASLERERREMERAEREKELLELEKLVQLQARLVVPEVIPQSVTISKTEPNPTPASSQQAPSYPSIATANDTTTVGQNETAENITSSQSLTSSQNMNSSHNMTSSPTSTASRGAPRSDSSESIYAFIIRRLNALEGNSTLVARYVEEQSRVMRLMLGKVERGWDDWRRDWDSEDHSRWQQERMRQEDRFGKVISQMEQQRLAMERERHAIMSQLRVLADELGYERRRGIAQLVIMLVIIVLGVASRSSTINAVLKPLLAEAKRRRSVYGGHHRNGPLTGLRIDLGEGRSPRIIGQNAEDSLGSPASPTPTTAKVRLAKSSSIARRSNTPSLRHRRQTSGGLNAFRSFSTSDHLPQVFGQTITSPTVPRPRVSLPPRPTGGAPPRRLARSAHLHTIEADRVRNRVRQEGTHNGRTLGAESDDASGQEETFSVTEISPLTQAVPTFSRSPDGEVEDWGTDGNASASEVDEEVISTLSEVVNDGDDDMDLIQELAAIWQNKEMQS
ncbi:UNC-like C-terminal-domain-containing protein [Naematelia encephala]|uniref:UNC-like C-terminal-domain-containing protein n=1 Tax=Naematelia encephala TaxID=71784 RepID=A0A1Y2BE86_9TREE|nr:UNC-like C-terminal-domain-containing protein [Naematelia encephala]